MKKQGMIWFNILRVLVPIGVLLNLLLPISTLQSYAMANGVSLNDFMNLYASAYSYSYLLYGFAAAIIGAVLTFRMWHKSPECAPTVRALIIINVVGTLLEYIGAYVSFGQFFAAEMFGALFGICLVWIPTYYYMRKRFSPTYQFAEPQPKAQSAPPPKPQPLYCADVPSNMADRIDRIADRLRGVSDQKERDNIIAMTFCGQLNPYSGQPMTSEKEWENYTQSYYEEMAWKMGEPAETKSKPEAAPAPELQPDVENSEHCAEETANKPTPEPEPQPEVQVKQQPEAERPKFCRKCGKPLRADSDFCEWCGESVK